MAKQRPLTSAQRSFLRYLSDGKWHPWSGQAITGSGLRGLMSRGLIERLNDPNESIWTWVRHGRFRLVKSDLQVREKLMADKTTSVEDALLELREMFGPEPQICVGIRDCGEECVTPRGTSLEYDAQIGMNGEEFSADTPRELMAQVRQWHAEQAKESKEYK